MFMDFISHHDNLSNVFSLSDLLSISHVSQLVYWVSHNRRLNTMAADAAKLKKIACDAIDSKVKELHEVGALSNPRGRIRRAPPKGPDSFRFDKFTNFMKCKPHWELAAPTMR